MNRKKTYPIRNINVPWSLHYGFSMPPHEGDCCVYWWDQIPLGHGWKPKADDNEPPSRSEKNFIWNTIKETIAFYCSRDNPNAFEELSLIWLHDDWESFTTKMQFMLSPYRLRDDAVTPDVALIIYTQNRPAQLKRCLNAVSRLMPFPAEIFVVDHAPHNDQTRQLVVGYPGIRYLVEESDPLSRARDIGWQAATSSIIACVDDDLRLHEDWVGQVVQAFDYPEVQAVTGLVFPEEIQSGGQPAGYGAFKGKYQDIYYGADFFKVFEADVMPAWSTGTGATMAFRRSALDSIGGFERLGSKPSAGNEKEELWYRLMKAGGDIHYTPRAIAYQPFKL